MSQASGVSVCKSTFSQCVNTEQGSPRATMLVDACTQNTGFGYGGATAATVGTAARDAPHTARVGEGPRIAGVS